MQLLLTMLTVINDDGVECEKVDVIQIKTVPKLMSVMSVKFAFCENYYA